MKNDEKVLRIIQSLVSYIFLCAVLALIWSMLSPSDIENQLLWGFSLNRWVMIGFIFLIIIGCLVLLTLSVLRKSTFQMIAEYYRFSAEKFSPFLFLLIIFWGLLLAISFTTEVENRYIFVTRLRPLFVMFFLISTGGAFVIFCFFTINHGKRLLTVSN
jgi:hypothetical protein